MDKDILKILNENEEFWNSFAGHSLPNGDKREFSKGDLVVYYSPKENANIFCEVKEYDELDKVKIKALLNINGQMLLSDERFFTVDESEIYFGNNKLLSNIRTFEDNLKRLKDLKDKYFKI